MTIHPQKHPIIPQLAANAVGAGLKPAHFAEILAARPDLGFFEIHAENYMNAGGPNHRWLAAIGEHYPLSVHGVGLSLGSTETLDRDHLARLKQVVDANRAGAGVGTSRLVRLFRPRLSRPAAPAL